jgi:predicted transposase YdaD
VVRVWQLDPEQLLSGGPGTLALAPVSAVPEGQIQDVIRRMNNRLSGRRAPRKARDIKAAAYVFLGLRYSDDIAYALFREVVGMEESSTYRAIVRQGREQGLLEGLAQGRVEGVRRAVLLQGEAKFGPPDDATRAAINAISDLEQLDELTLRLMNVTSWQDLMPLPPRRNGRRRRGR